MDPIINDGRRFRSILRIRSGRGARRVVGLMDRTHYLHQAPGAGAVRVAVRGGHRLGHRPHGSSGLGTRDAALARPSAHECWRWISRPWDEHCIARTRSWRLERHLFDRAMGLFDLHPTVTLYDLTNTFFERGGASEGRAGTPRTNAPIAPCSPWRWCSIRAASCVAPRCSPATCENTTRWPKCSKRSTPRARRSW